jgi:hypothetical protein
MMNDRQKTANEVRKRIGFLLLPVLLFFFSCEDETVNYHLGEYYQEIVTVLEKNVFVSDAGKTYFNVHSNDSQSYDENVRRVFLTYSYAKEKIPPYDQAIIVLGSSPVTTGDLKAVSQKEINDFPTDPILLESLWIGSHYLNMQFYFDYKSEMHTIGLLTDSTRLDNDTIRLYFKHDIKNDPPGHPTHLFLSFDLEKVLNKPENNRPLLIHIHTGNYGNKTYELKY